VVRPYVGDLNPVAYDSADEIYAAALASLGVKTKGVHPSAYRAMLEMQPRAGQRQQPRALATDSGDARKSVIDKFPGAARIGIMG
jgi:hypothetical protein